MRTPLGIVLFLLTAAVTALSTAGGRLLVVLDDLADRDAYTLFLGDIESRGFEIAYETPRSERLRLSHLGERTYDHIVFLPAKVKGLGPNLTPKHLVEFVKAGGNVVVALASTTPAPSSLVSFLAEFEVTLPAERTGLVVDHFNYDSLSAAEAHDVLVLDAPAKAPAATTDLFTMPGAVLVLPRTSGHVLGQSPLLTPLLRAPFTAYSYNPKDQLETVDPDDLFASGQQLALVTTVQARNSARVAIIGSAEMLQDKWMEAKVAHVDRKPAKVENREFAKRLTGWAFQEIGVLRVNSIEHHLKGSKEMNPAIYRIKNDVTFSISMSEYSWDKWVPFKVPKDDYVQMEFSMLSPFVRLNLRKTKTTETATIFSREFMLPDQHGIFNFRVNYKRDLLTYVDEKRTVSVRHIAHDEWPRSFDIVAAWPWLSGLWATIMAWVMFCALWLYSAPPRRGGGRGQARG
ncbi:hypothetical protein XA68_11606 [Ophiocordyceps unilateralis]|uniref:Dolichyl-diphosphooligosaccharide--protein glycosyltransferase subunit WBP1 n=1 Tax=Ophiocordyceps unilateralis TaxID=268505 RepID=A0A2A9PMV7_OPHUN|nr:hypothetical protein XA68_11606 [Ophiocordyceps unilateralis]